MRKWIYALIAWVCTHHVQAQQSPPSPMYQGTVLLELFSSEGCSSCPLASQFMGEILRIADSTGSPVYVLDYHVDIWNSSGWVDPFSDSVYTAIQATYMQKAGQSALFTPMLFINGQYGLPAGDRKQVGNGIYNALSAYGLASLTLNAAMLKTQKSLQISYSITTALPKDTMELVLIWAEKSIVSKPTAGENAGLTIEHHHIVRQIKTYPVQVLTGNVTYDLPPLGADFTNYILIGYLRNKHTWQVYTTDELGFKKN